MSFRLSKAPAKVAHINLREEKHGEDPVLGCDLKITADVANDFLTMLSPTLKSSLYQAEGERPGDQVGLIDDATHLPVLRYPQLGGLPWDLKMPGTLVILHAAKKKDSVEIAGEVNQLKLEPKEGGTVAITFRVQFEPVDVQVGSISALLGHAIKISVLPAGDVAGGEQSDEE